MNQEKVGKFISQCRKEKGITQAQLAAKFGVSNVAVSKWENGKSCPDVSIMIELCDLLGITVNELLSGERINTEDYKEKAESNLISAQSEQKNLKRKTKLFKGILLGTVAVLVVLWIIDKIPFSQNIDQTVAAVIYKDNAIVGETSVYMNGNKTRYLFREDSFVGEFRVFSVERMNVDDLQTRIQWFRNQEMQRMSHFYKGDFQASIERGIVHYLIISNDMKDFAIITTQHEIIATSVKAYKLCAQYIVYNDDGTITVNGGWFGV